MEHEQNQGRPKKGIRKFPRSQQDKIDFSRLELEQYIESHIEEAIEKRWIKVYLQVNIRGLSRKVCGAEALSRWNDPKYGMIYPGDFIPVLEKCLKIHLLDFFVFEEVCRNIAKRRNRGEAVFPISLNFSRLDFDVERFIDKLDDLVALYKIPKSILHVEITESVVMHNEEYMKFAVRQLREQGYKVWMDDFGSGYSSLNLLKEFEFDTFKIDMRFLSDMGKKSLIIISSILYMAKEIGIHTVAEGVETEEQYQFLKAAGCERMQGYCFGRPEPIENWLKERIEENGVESGEDTFLYDRVGLVNILSPTPFVFDRLDETPTIYGFETVLPMALVSEKAGKIKHLNWTKPYKKTIEDLGYEGIEEFQGVLNDEKSLVVERIKDTISLAKDSLGIETTDFISRGQYCQIQVRRVTSKGNSYIYLLRIDILTNNDSFQKLNHLDNSLRPLYSMYDTVILLDLQKNTLLPIYRTNAAEKIERSNDLTNDLDKYLHKYIHPDDFARCREFFNPSDMWERLGSNGEGFVLSYFRAKNKEKKYVWKRYILIRSEEAQDERRVIFGIHTLNMEKLSFIKDEAQMFFMENHKEQLGDAEMFQ